MPEHEQRPKRQQRRRNAQQEAEVVQTAASPSPSIAKENGCENAVTICPPREEDRGADDERESLVNDCRRGPANFITPKVEEVASIHAFMNDLDCKILDPAVVGKECVESAELLYEQHVQHWLDRDSVLAKAEVRDTGGGLHVVLRMDAPIIVGAGEALMWDEVARGICNALPGDPNLNGIIALTRPVGAINSKYDPPREVRLLRPGESVTRAEILDLNRRVTEQPARLWMRVFFGGERASPCPLCGGTSLGVAGYWQCRCYGCGRVNAASLVYRFYSPKFLDQRMEASHG